MTSFNSSDEINTNSFDSMALLNRIIRSDLYSAHRHDSEHDHDHGGETDGHHDSNFNELLVAKATAMCVLFAASMLCGMIPFKLSQWFKWSATLRSGSQSGYAGHIIAMLLAFGGGVLLCTTFLHMLPEVTENIDVLKQNKQLPEFLNTASVHYGQLLMCLGFFAMYLVEEIVHLYLHRFKNEHRDGDGAFERSISNRNSRIITTAAGKNISAGSGNSVLHARFSNKKKASLSVAELITSADGNDVESGSIVGINYSSPINDTLEYNYDKNNIQIISQNQKNNNNVANISLGHPTASNKRDCEHEHEHEHEQQHEYEQHNHSQMGHSHLPLDENSDDDNIIVSSLRGLLIVLALSVHELFEGLAVGLESSTSNVWYMFGAVATHKLVIAFCVGVELIVNKTRFCLAVVYVCTFAIVSPIGIGMGILISHKGTPKDIELNGNLLIFDSTDGLRNDSDSSGGGHSPNIAAVVLQGLATGTLLYVVFFEILIKGRMNVATNGRSAIGGILQYIAVLIGFFVMFGMQFLGKFFLSIDFICSSSFLSARAIITIYYLKV